MVGFKVELFIMSCFCGFSLNFIASFEGALLLVTVFLL